MGAEHGVARSMLEHARDVFVQNVRGISLDEWLDTGGGYRSILGLMKHAAGWSAVYLSYAFDAEPRHWKAVDWPRGLRDTIDPTEAYAGEILSWFNRTAEAWLEGVADPAGLDAPHPLHWGGTAPLGTIVAMVAGHWEYHAGEINAILAIRRQEAWEYGEEVEENHISTAGHGVRPPWMSDADAEAHERNVREGRDQHRASMQTLR